MIWAFMASGRRVDGISQPAGQAALDPVCTETSGQVLPATP